LRVGRVNVDENPSTTARFEITTIPTLLVIERGREIDRISGVQTKAEIARRIARILRDSPSRPVSSL
jgi:thioredoxin-like negative regulator of GroEL